MSDLHWKTGRQKSCQFNLAHKQKKENKNVLNETEKVKQKITHTTLGATRIS